MRYGRKSWLAHMLVVPSVKPKLASRKKSTVLEVCVGVGAV